MFSSAFFSYNFLNLCPMSARYFPYIPLPLILRREYYINLNYTLDKKTIIKIKYSMSALILFILYKTFPTKLPYKRGACAQPYKYGCFMQNNLIYKDVAAKTLLVSIPTLSALLTIILLTAHLKMRCAGAPLKRYFFIISCFIYFSFIIYFCFE